MVLYGAYSGGESPHVVALVPLRRFSMVFISTVVQVMASSGCAMKIHRVE